MENRLFRNSVPMEGIGSRINPNSLFQCESIDLNNQNQTLDGYNFYSTLQGPLPINNLHTSTRVEIPNLGSLVPKNTEFEEQLMSGLPFSGALTSLVSSRDTLQQNVPNFAVSEAFRTYISNEVANGLSSSFTSMNYGPTEPFDSRFQPCVAIADPFGSCSLSNELSLSLATSEPSSINVTNVSDQCSEISCSGSSSKEFSLSCGSYRNGRFSQGLSGSKYLQVVQEILTEIALEIFEQTSFSNGVIKTGLQFTYPEMCNVDRVFEVHVDPALQKRALEAKKAQLLTLLQVVDDRYGHCIDEIHTVISAFHAATELDPQLHARFTLQTISFFYKSLRERISNQILGLGDRTDRGIRDLEQGSHYFQKQWTLQQLKKKDHQLWKPQRGLPERSVSVLRAWMFQNFLHPYPKDAEKHLLAIKSGLTRSQVSNWFINARVRLWKPMIEEMYAEMNKRKGRQNEEGSSNNHRNEFSFGNLRFNMNSM